MGSNPATLAAACGHNGSAETDEASSRFLKTKLISTGASRELVPR